MMRRRMGRPGLVGTMARTAVVAGTATAVHGSMTNRRANKAADQQAAAAQEQQAMVDQAAAQAAAQVQAQQPPAAPPPAAAAAEDPTISKLKELASLKDQGILSDDEFASAKAKILGL